MNPVKSLQHRSTVKEYFENWSTALSTLLILLLKLGGERSFLASPNLDYAGYHKYTDEMLPSESPAVCVLHPSAEMGYLTTTLLGSQPINSVIGEGSGQSAKEKVKFFTLYIVSPANDMWNTHLPVLCQ